MDASKAFDKVNHWHLFDKLLNRGVPVYVVRMLLYWHTYQDFIVRWNNTLSHRYILILTQTIKNTFLAKFSPTQLLASSGLLSQYCR